ncbi:MAG: short-chain fatty acyl-CoA regulator family protein [Pseudomonadota bacterium]
MAARERSTFLGPRLRRIRRDLGVTQATMAQELGVSASYIALMERNQRPVTADLLLRLAQTYRLDIADLADKRSDTFVRDLRDAIADPLFEDLDIAALEIEDIARSFPGITEAMLRLYATHKESRLALADRRDGPIPAADPIAEARRFLAARRNSFPGVDDAAEVLRRQIDKANGFEAHLADRHKIKTRRLPRDVMMGATRRLDHHRGELSLEESLDRASANFQLALQIAYLELNDAIEDALSDGGFVSTNGERLGRRALANYAAGALIMPYRAFVRAAEDRRYDIEILSRIFGASFEQVSHRLTTLQKTGQEGVPFFFIRVDAAGNISKRLDGAGFPFARHGGSCPLWSVHNVFKSPRRIITQWLQLEGGERYFSIARTVTAGGGAFDAPQVERAVALACAERFADRLVYADGLSKQDATPIGVTCRFCQRIDCAARAEPPIGRAILADDFRRNTAPFGLSDG